MKNLFYFKFKSVAIIVFLFITVNVFNQEIIRVKFKPETVKTLGSFGNQIDKLSSSGYVVTNIPSVDNVITRYHGIEMKRLFRDAGKFEARHRKYGLHLWYEIKLKNPTKTEYLSCIRDFSSLEEVYHAEAIHEKSLDIVQNQGDPKPAFSTNDPQFAQQWHYNNTGQTGGTAGADISLVEAWDIQTGSDQVIVAVTDGGIDYTHEDLADAMWINNAEANGSTGVDDDLNGYVDDIYGYGFADNTGSFLPDPDGHGTHVAGTIGAVNNNGIGLSGVAGGSGSGDGVRLMSCAVFSAYGGAGGFEEAYVYAADMGAVINQNSWGYTSSGYYEQSVLDAIDYFIANAGKDLLGNQTGPLNGGLVIFAAGNSSSSSSHYPAYYSPVVAVASTNHNDQLSWYSNYGSWIDISAPGGETNSSTNQGVLSTLPGNSYGYYQGTSMACPHVSGVAALLVSQYGGMGTTPQLIRDLMINSADSIDALNPGYGGMLGSGRINAFNAIQLPDSIPPAAIQDLVVIDSSEISVTLSWTATGGSDTVGRASYYEIRYAEFKIDSGNFELAQLYSTPPTPDYYGNTETFTLTGLNSTTKYYFALKAHDPYGNISALSNIDSVTTLDAPEYTIDKETLQNSTDNGSTIRDSITISNTGLEDLWFTIDTAASYFPFFNYSFSQISDTLLPGENITVYIDITDNGNSPGNYFECLFIFSNDPLQPYDSIAVLTHVNGSPQIFTYPEQIDFSNLFITDTISNELFISNIGTDSLHIDSIVSNNDVFFVKEIEPCDLYINDSVWVDIFFAPIANISYYDSIAIYTNAVTDSVYYVRLTGTGLLPPVISVTPDSFDVHLFTGDSLVRTLTINNTSGGSELIYDIRISDDSVSVLSPQRINKLKVDGISLEKIQGKKVTYSYEFERIDDNGEVSSISSIKTSSLSNDLSGMNIALTTSSRPYFVAELELKGANTFYTSYNSAMLDSINVLVIDDYDISSIYTLEINHWIREGGCLIIDGDEDLDIYDSLIFGSGIDYLSISSNSGITYDIGDHTVTDSITEYYIGSSSLSTLSLTGEASYLIKDLSGNTYAAAANLNNGKILAICNESLTSSDDNAIRLGVNAIRWFKSNTGWLSIDTLSGVVPVGLSTDIHVNFNATGLYGGIYQKVINISSNDPVNSNVDVLATLTVTGVPLIETSTDSVNFPATYAGYTSKNSFEIINTGTDSLRIDSITYSSPDFITDSVPDIILPEYKFTCNVTYNSSSAGISVDTLYIYNNSKDSIIKVSLHTESYISPEMVVTPDSFDVHLFTGDSLIRSLTIDNSTGGSDLIFDISIIDSTGLTVIDKNELPERKPGINNEGESVLNDIDASVYAIGDIDSLSNSPVNLCCMAIDPNTGLIYGQQYSGYSFYVYDPKTDLWSSLAQAPLYGSNGGATFMNGKVYTSYSSSSNIGIYDIATDSWTYQYVGVSTGNITNDGNLLYLASSYYLYSYDVTSQTRNTVSSSSPIYFYDYGGLEYIDNKLYGHRGSGYTDFVAYDLNSDTWTVLPSIPGGTVLGSAYDNDNDKFYAYGSYSGYNIYEYDIKSGEWNTFYQNQFAVGDGGLVYNPKYKKGIYFIQGDYGTGFAKLETGYGYISMPVTSDTVPAGTSIDLDVIYDATELYGGIYMNILQITSNDSANKMVNLLSTLTVTGIPYITTSKDSIIFDTVFVGYNQNSSVTISNTGTDTLRIDSIEHNLDVFSISDTIPSYLLPEESYQLNLNFNSAVNNSYQDTLLIYSNSSDSIYKISMKAVAILPPIMTVTPDTINLDMLSGESQTEYVSIGNIAGGSRLIFDLSHEYVNVDQLFLIDTFISSSLESTTDLLPIRNAEKSDIDTNASILVIQDSYAWDLDMGTFIYDNFGINPTVINSSNISSYDFNDYDLVITTGDQSSTYYNYISTYRSKFEDFVTNGGTVQYQLATQGSNVLIVDNAEVIYGNMENYNMITDTLHPITDGISSPMYGNYANHCYISNLPGSANIIASTQTSDSPTIAEYKYGAGNVIVTGMTWEYLYYNGLECGGLLTNSVAYALDETGYNKNWLKYSDSINNVYEGTSEIIPVQVNTEGMLTGDYKALFMISGNDPVNLIDTVVFNLHVTGYPEIISDSLIKFENIFIGNTYNRVLHLTNVGYDTLKISNITSNNSELIFDHTSLNILAGHTDNININYNSSNVYSQTDTITITYNSESGEDYKVPVIISAVEPPVIGVNPAEISLQMATDYIHSEPLTINNTGNSNLTYTIGSDSIVPLESVLDELNGKYENITTVIPQIYNFTDGNSSYRITDGGDNMYDYGNYLESNLGGYIYYSDKYIQSSYYFGSSGRYFTAKYPGLFVLAADIDQINYFEIFGSLGCSGSGSADTSTIEMMFKGRNYKGFVKRVYDYTTPSVNHLIIVENPDEGITQNYDPYTGSDYHQINNLTNVSRIYYLLWAGQDGFYYTDSMVEDIMESFLVSSDPTGWITYSKSSGTVSSSGSDIIDVTFNTNYLDTGTYYSQIDVLSNDPVNPVVSIPVELEVSYNLAPVIANPVNDLDLFLSGEDYKIDLNYVFVDPENDVMTYSCSSSNSSIAQCTIDASNILTLNLKSTGVAIINVTCTDIYNNATTESFYVTIRQNQKPILIGTIDDIDTYITMETIDIDLSEIFSDPDGGALQYSVNIVPTNICNLELNDSILSIHPESLGSAAFIITAYDLQNDSISTGFVVNVLSNNPPEMVAEMHDTIVFIEDQFIKMNMNPMFNDQDGDKLYYTARVTDENIATPILSDNNLYLYLNNVGFTIVEIEATDKKTSTCPVASFATIVKMRTSLNEISGENIILYPNPTDGKFSIDLSAINDKNIVINIFSSTGEHITDVQAVSGINEIDLSDISNGMYILQIKTDQNLIQKTIVVK